jgi:uncharacterized membrane protein YphA (DoxX/SURF4 family)
MFWVTLFRLLLGVVSAIDGLEKLGWMTPSPSSAAAGELQPSPLGPLSALIELVAGLFVLVGLRCRTACLVLGVHLALGLLVAKLRNSASLANYPQAGAVAFFVVLLLITGPNLLSIDYFWPDLLPRLFSRTRRAATSPDGTPP